ncbi:MAG: hypothetical protein HKO59_10370, partial [Phycisphaerales bacterium]|nr:hypothetical protein [Phycisphaerales bacterium]
VNAMAYNLVFVAGFSTVLFNANPLLKFDGYYILSDLCEVPNLANRSRDLIKSLLKRYVLRVPRVPAPAVHGAERWWLPVYGVAATVYRIGITAGIILFIVDKFFLVGILLAISGVVAGLVLPCSRLLRYLAADSELSRGRRRACVTVAMIATIALLGVGVIPVPASGRSEGLIEPAHIQWIFAETDGFIGDVLVNSGVVVQSGEELLAANNFELETKRTRLIAQRRIAELERDRARMGETALAQSLSDRIQALDEQIARMDRRREALRVRAPASGWWIAPEFDRLSGAFVERGQRLGMVADIERLFVRAVANQRLGPRLESEVGLGAPVQVRVRGRPDLRLLGTLREVLPAGSDQLPSAALGYLGGGFTPVAGDDATGTTSTEPFFEVHVDLDDANIDAVGLCSGQRVVVRFELPRSPLLTQAWRGLRQLVQRRFQV